MKETVKITIELPQEFVDRCERDLTTPEEVLRGFIADLCRIYNLAAAPRLDGYSSNGSDERELAWEYYKRVGYPHNSR